MSETLLAALGGLLAGSFLNVCIYRLPRDLSVVQPRSFCPECRQQIAWFDNVPVLSHLLLGGKCRWCGRRIPARYPAVEILTAGLFAAAVLRFGWGWEAAKLCLFLAAQVCLFFTDMEERILPDEFTLGGIVAALALTPWAPPPAGLALLLLPGQPALVQAYADLTLGALIPPAILGGTGALYLRIRRREGLGLGDVKMLAMIGAFLGISGSLLTLAVASLLGSIGGLAYILITRQDAGSYPLPLGSFLAFAAAIIGLFDLHRIVL